MGDGVLIGAIGGLIALLGIFLGTINIVGLADGLPSARKEAEDALKYLLSAVALLGIGSLLMYSDIEFLVYISAEKGMWILYVTNALFLVNLAMLPIYYRRLKRFEQEEMFERLAEKMGEKLGESMAKGLKARDS
ncbi:hypothetical protein [Thermococcus sp.]